MQDPPPPPAARATLVNMPRTTLRVFARAPIFFLALSAVQLVPQPLFRLFGWPHTGYYFLVPVAIAEILRDLMHAAMLDRARRLLDERKPRLRATLGPGLRRALPVLAVSLIQFVAFSFGCVLLVLPGLLVSAALLVAGPICLQGASPLASLKRSWVFDARHAVAARRRDPTILVALSDLRLRHRPLQRAERPLRAVSALGDRRRRDHRLDLDDRAVRRRLSGAAARCDARRDHRGVHVTTYGSGIRLHETALTKMKAGTELREWFDACGAPSPKGAGWQSRANDALGDTQDRCLASPRPFALRPFTCFSLRRAPRCGPRRHRAGGDARQLLTRGAVARRASTCLG